jgi:hypothetical protein
MASWSDFLIEKARQYDLSKGEMDLLVTQFNEENINTNKTEREWAESVGRRLAAYKKSKSAILRSSLKVKLSLKLVSFYRW